MNIKCCILPSFYILILGTNYFYTDAFSLNSTTLNRNFTRYKRQNGNDVGCIDGFQCKNTAECIDIEKECDGKEDCKDGSDEYETLCKNIPCPGYLFKCDYGGCITGTLRCDGKTDCKDNSDETSCPSTAIKINSNCKSDEFECQNGQCISLDYKCDGVANCADKSDETRATCFNIFCPGYAYRCAYGGCVDGDARCNGVRDCLDNSDEEKCGPTAPKPTPVVPVRTTEPPIDGGTCTTPKQPANGQWTFAHNNQIGTGGTAVQINTYIIFTCNQGYKLTTTNEKNDYVICIGSNTWQYNEMPQCEKLCKPYYSSPTTTLKCKNFITGSEIQCDKATNNTELSFSCAPYYEPPGRVALKRYCYDGRWNLEKPECIQVCGEKAVSAQPLIVNGKTVERGHYPWMIAVYQKRENWVNICGGAMLTQRVILTAAHCVSNDKGVANDKSLYKIAAGKYYNRYQDSRDLDTAEYAGVQEILVSKLFKSVIQNYVGDIAILVTDRTLPLSKVVQPVCYNGIDNFNLGSSSVGVITGWGYTLAGGTPSDVLKELDLPYKDRSQCEAELPEDFFEKYYTHDKFCAGYLNQNLSVCKGDSGSPLVFKLEKRYYIRGIVSVSRSLGHETCDIQKSALFTDVVSHYDWITREISRIQSALGGGVDGFQLN